MTTEPAPEVPREPPDRFVYNWVMFEREEGFQRLEYEAMVSSIGRERERARRVRGWIEQHLARSREAHKNFPFVDISVSHEMVRLLKSVELLYLEHLHRKRDALASRPTTSKALLEALDQQLAKLKEKTEQGVFQAASPYPLVLDQLPLITVDPTAVTSPSSAELAPRPRAVVLDSIEIRDLELRRRCLDLLAQFQQDIEHDRLDTVISEATRILEDRLRALAGAATACSGVDLATFAFGSRPPRLAVSEVPAEQEAAHLLYRGIFGFVRNSAHHRLLGALQPERVLQIVGMVDYFIHVAEAATRNVPGAPTSEPGEKRRS